MPVKQKRKTTKVCSRKSRPEVESIARKVLGKPYSDWKPLSKEVLCMAVGQESDIVKKNLKKTFAEASKTRNRIRTRSRSRSGSRNNKVTKLRNKSLARERFNMSVSTSRKEANIMKRRLLNAKEFSNYKHKTKMIKVIAKGAQGVARLYRNTKFDFISKLSNIDKDELRLPVIRNNLDEHNPESLLQYEKARSLEFVVEIAASRLASELVTQNICPHFPILYEQNFTFVSGNMKLETNMEAVSGGTTLQSWSKENHQLEVWYSVIFQLLVALYTLYEQYGMSHRDLHAKNVLMYNLGKDWKNGYFQYNIKGKNYYVPVFGVMVCIIDFGRVNIPGKLHIKWHEQALREQFKNHGIKYTYDASYLIDLLLYFKFVPKVVKESLLIFVEDFLDSDAYFSDFFETMFSKTVHGIECGKGWTACYDMKPPAGHGPIAKFNIDKKVKLPSGKNWDFMRK